MVVEDQKSRERETYYLVFGDALEFEEGHVTMASPIGRALLGKAVGEVAFLKLPTMHAPAESRGAQDHPRPGRERRLARHRDRRARRRVLKALHRANDALEARKDLGIEHLADVLRHHRQRFVAA